MVKFRLFFFSVSLLLPINKAGSLEMFSAWDIFIILDFLGSNFYINIGRQDMGEAFLKSILPEGIVLIAKITQKRSFDEI